MAVFSTSRFNLSAFIEVRDSFGELVENQRMDIRPRILDIDRPSNREYSVQSGDRWDVISSRLLGDPRNWWIIGDFSQVLDPFTELVVGKKLIIPSRNTVLFDILNFTGPRDAGGPVLVSP